MAHGMGVEVFRHLNQRRLLLGFISSSIGALIPLSHLDADADLSGRERTVGLVELALQGADHIQGFVPGEAKVAERLALPGWRHGRL